MIGISEEKLKQLLTLHQSRITFKKFKDNKTFSSASKYVLETLIAVCEELNSWLPIDQAPKDRRILLFYPTFGKVTGEWNEELGWKADQQIIPNDLEPSHFQELPPDPAKYELNN